MDQLIGRWNMHKALPRFLDYVEDYSSFDSCWIWKGIINNKRYGRFSWLGKYWLAHRWIYLYCYGILDNKLVIDHICTNTLCVNPIHLEQVNKGENKRRGKKTNTTTPEDIRRLMYDLYYVERHTMQYVADTLHVSLNSVRKVLNEYGGQKTKRVWLK